MITIQSWTIKKCPPGERVIGGRWVYSLKQDKDGEISKYKARYVARGFSQIPGIDYYDTYAPTTRLTSVRMLMQISVQYDLIVHQMDVKTAYLNANIDADIFIEQPKGFEEGKNDICHLNKSIYRVSTPKVHQNSRSFPGFLKVDLKFSRCKNYSYIEHCRSNIIQIRVLFVLTLESLSMYHIRKKFI